MKLGDTNWGSCRDFLQKKNCKRFEPVVVDGMGGRKEERRREKVKRKGYLSCLA